MSRTITRWLGRPALIALTVGLAAAGASATTAKADGVTPGQLTAAGWTCIQPGRFPTGTPGFADRLPSYENLVFDFVTGAFLGTQHALRPDIYEQGKPPCPQQPGGQYFYNAFNDLWICQRT
jgi:hypothetical protein